MSSRSRRLFLSLPAWISTGAAALFLCAGCDRAAEASQGERGAHATATAISDQAIAPFQSELLEIAIEAATALPIDPHIKTRSRLQESVVDCSLELAQPHRAFRDIEKIEDWRRGAGYADLAFHCAQHGEPDEAKRYLELARQVAESTEDESIEDDSGQGWRRARIRAKIAKTYVWLGDKEHASEFEASLAASDAAEVELAKAMRLDAAELEKQMESIDAVVATGDFEQVKNSLAVCSQLFDRAYEDEALRSRAEEKLKVACKRLPAQVRIEQMTGLAKFALKHGDRAKALQLVNEMQQIAEGTKWTPEDGISLMARLAGLRFEAGDEARARADADAQLAKFDTEREQIVNIYRADALRSLAEAYRTMGDTAAALKIYRRAVDAGVENPNSRPRAEDLVATCCSMALRSVEPDAELRARIKAIHVGLGAPW